MFQEDGYDMGVPFEQAHKLGTAIASISDNSDAWHDD
jgi:hypothetical protein